MDSIIAVGSIMDVTDRDSDEIEALMNARLLLICDRSYSMKDRDPTGHQKYSVEDEVVATLQSKYRGQIALMPFNNFPYLALNGILPAPDGQTNLTAALEMALPLVSLDLRAVVISDGYPDDPQGALAIARGMKHRLDCIYIGEPGSQGDLFMQELAMEAEGSHQVNEATQLLEHMIEVLLLKSGEDNIPTNPNDNTGNLGKTSGNSWKFWKK